MPFLLDIEKAQRRIDEVLRERLPAPELAALADSDLAAFIVDLGESERGLAVEPVCAAIKSAFSDNRAPKPKELRDMLERRPLALRKVMRIDGAFREFCSAHPEADAAKTLGACGLNGGFPQRSVVPCLYMLNSNTPAKIQFTTEKRRREAKSGKTPSVTIFEHMLSASQLSIEQLGEQLREKCGSLEGEELLNIMRSCAFGPRVTKMNGYTGEARVSSLIAFTIWDTLKDGKIMLSSEKGGLTPGKMSDIYKFRDLFTFNPAKGSQKRSRAVLESDGNVLPSIAQAVDYGM